MEQTYEEIYNSFWKELVETNGQLDPNKVKRELADYSTVIDQVSKAYCQLTNGQISKPHTMASQVVAETEKVFDRFFVGRIIDELLPELDQDSNAYQAVIEFARTIDSEEVERHFLLLTTQKENYKNDK